MTIRYTLTDFIYFCVKMCLSKNKEDTGNVKVKKVHEQI